MCEQLRVAATALYAIDRSVFRYAAPDATGRTPARLNSTVALDDRGMPAEAGAAGRSRGGGKHAPA